MSSEDKNEENEPHQYINLPQKSKFRMHAHCNPLSCVSIPYPFAPNCVDWTIHYPVLSNLPKSANNVIKINTDKFPIDYRNENYHPIATSKAPKDSEISVNIVDIGCGYGGLLFNMSSHLGEGDIAVGMEIRDKVTNFVGERIKILRLNSQLKEYNNISVIRTNTMKLLLNYFYKGQLDKMFFCFADPHFKKYNHRKRIINKYLLNDYSYVLKKGGKLYSITDVEELHNWHVEVIKQNPCFRRMSEEEIKDDEFIKDMKNTDEARKVMKKKGNMYIAVYERVDEEIKSLHELYDKIDYSVDE